MLPLPFLLLVDAVRVKAVVVVEPKLGLVLMFKTDCRWIWKHSGSGGGCNFCWRGVANTGQALLL